MHSGMIDSDSAIACGSVSQGGGHSYQGTSNAPDSLLVWTCAINGIVTSDSFVPRGCEGHAAPVPAVTIGAGAVKRADSPSSLEERLQTKPFPRRGAETCIQSESLWALAAARDVHVASRPETLTISFAAGANLASRSKPTCS
jgi:hypothetical protein